MFLYFVVDIRMHNNGLCLDPEGNPYAETEMIKGSNKKSLYECVGWCSLQEGALACQYDDEEPDGSCYAVKGPIKNKDFKQKGSSDIHCVNLE